MTESRIALVTGGSKGLGAALVKVLAGAGWRVVTDGRDAAALAAMRDRLPAGDRDRVVAIQGDVTRPEHRAALVDAAGDRLDLLINNAGALGPSPLPLVADLNPADLAAIFTVNVLAPLALAQAALPALRAAGGVLINITSDAAVGAYPGWGGYGATKAALAQLDNVLAAEQPDLAIWTLDPGDVRTDMHQAAFPGEDISDRPLPDEVAPALLGLLAARPPSGRWQLAAYAPAATAR
jgi:NAD(P)-dependent dehydrogenase (short-subunit alcohol dehydrogenase family)